MSSTVPHSYSINVLKKLKMFPEIIIVFTSNLVLVTLQFFVSVCQVFGNTHEGVFKGKWITMTTLNYKKTCILKQREWKRRIQIRREPTSQKMKSGAKNRGSFSLFVEQSIPPSPGAMLLLLLPWPSKEKCTEKNEVSLLEKMSSFREKSSTSRH